MTRAKPPRNSGHPAKPQQSGRAATKRQHHPLRVFALVLALAVVTATAGIFFVPQKKLPLPFGKHPAVTALYDTKTRIVAVVEKAGNKTPPAAALPKQQGYTDKDRRKLDALIESETPHD